MIRRVAAPSAGAGMLPPGGPAPAAGVWHREALMACTEIFSSRPWKACQARGTPAPRSAFTARPRSSFRPGRRRDGGTLQHDRPLPKIAGCRRSKARMRSRRSTVLRPSRHDLERVCFIAPRRCSVGVQRAWCYRDAWVLSTPPARRRRPTATRRWEVEVAVSHAEHRHCTPARWRLASEPINALLQVTRHYSLACLKQYRQYPFFIRRRFVPKHRCAF